MPAFVIPVVALNQGFVGQAITTNGPCEIVARQVNTTRTSSTMPFGSPVVYNADGSVSSLYDAITNASLTFTAPLFLGIAVDEIHQQTSYPTSTGNSIGFYSAGQIGDVLKRGTATVLVTRGTPAVNGTVYVRTVANGTYPNSPVGGFEAAADSSNTVALTNVRFLRGLQDSNGITEVEILYPINA